MATANYNTINNNAAVRPELHISYTARLNLYSLASIIFLPGPVNFSTFALFILLVCSCYLVGPKAIILILRFRENENRFTNKLRSNRLLRNSKIDFIPMIR